MSGSNAYSPARDLTMKQPAAGPGMSAQLLFMCQHKGGRTGALMRGRIPYRCANCVAKDKT
jgi:hypothetical protein